MNRRRRYIKPVKKFIESSIPITQTHWETFQDSEGKNPGACMRLRNKRFYVTSSDVTLKPHPHADAIIAFVLHILGGYRILRKPAVDPIFAQNLQKLTGIWKNWWSLPNRTLPVHSGGNGWQRPEPAGKRKTGLFFTAGVDSFFTLIRNQEKIDVLIFVIGFDIKTDDSTRINYIIQKIRTIGKIFEKDVWILHTNLLLYKPLTCIKAARWINGTMALVGWLLCDELERLVISSSFYRNDDKQKNLPWGSHWDTDKLWSASDLQIIHWGEWTERLMKLSAIADNPHVQRHLFVCRKNHGQTGNCGICEKCARTRLAFRFIGYKEDIEPFAGAPDLCETIDRIKKIPKHLLPIYERFPLDQLSANLKNSVSRLIERSKMV